MRIGVDLGGTKIEAVAMDDEGTELARPRVSTPAGDYEATVRAVARLVADVESKVGASGTVGIGTPGSLSPTTGLIRNANSVVLNDRPLHTDLERALQRPVRMANDADCLALSESADGAGAGQRVVFAVILGTGVGGGVCLDGQVWSGPNRVAGEWGHTPLPWAPDDLVAERCWCGRLGCVETWLSGPAFEQRWGEGATAEQLAQRAQAGEPEASQALLRYAELLARGLAGVIDVLDPDVIVLGGGLSRVGLLYEQVPRRWQRHVFSDAVTTPLLPAVHGDSSGVRGAARLWDD